MIQFFLCPRNRCEVWTNLVGVAPRQPPGPGHICSCLAEQRVVRVGVGRVAHRHARVSALASETARKKNCVILLLRKRMTQFFLRVNPTGTGARSGPTSSASRRDNHLDISAPVSRNKGSSASESAESPIVTRACWASETARKKTVSFFCFAKERHSFLEKAMSFFCETKERHSFFSGSFRCRLARVMMGGSADSNADDPLWVIP